MSEKKSEQQEHGETRVDPSEIKENTRVRYKPIGQAGTTSLGHVRRVLHHTEEVGSTLKHIRADEDHPRFLIENDHTHKETAYKLENIVTIVNEDAEH